MKLDEAEKMFQRALQGREKILGLDHTQTLDTVNCIGTVYKDQGRLNESMEMLQRALKGKERILGPDHVDTLDVLHNIANLLKHLGRLEEAEKMYLRALHGSEQAWGANHPSTITTICALGSLYYTQNKLSEAVKMYQQALQRYNNTIGPERVRFYLPALKTAYSLGLTFARQNNTEEARGMLVKAVEGFWKVYGDDHPKTKDAQECLLELDTVESEEMPSRRRRFLRKLGWR
jgi:tetratricopeptide (TPR) repeat protein